MDKIASEFPDSDAPLLYRIHSIYTICGGWAVYTFSGPLYSIISLLIQCSGPRAFWIGTHKNRQSCPKGVRGRRESIIVAALLSPLLLSTLIGQQHQSRLVFINIYALASSAGELYMLASTLAMLMYSLYRTWLRSLWFGKHTDVIASAYCCCCVIISSAVSGPSMNVLGWREGLHQHISFPIHK